MTSPLLVKVVYINLAIILTTTVLYFGKPVFMPLAIAGVLALVFMPLCRWLEKNGMGMVSSSIICGVIFTLLVAGVILFISYYFNQMATDLSGVMKYYFRL